MKEEEANPSSSTSTAWKLGGGSAGAAVGKGVSTAAKLSLTAGHEAVKVSHVACYEWTAVQLALQICCLAMRV